MRERSGKSLSFFLNLHFITDKNIRFGEDSVEKMVDWALEHVPASSNPRILDIGSGNGTLLFALCDAGYATPYLSGIDYRPDAVKLARMVARTRESEEIAFHVCDFLSQLPPPHVPGPGQLDVLDLEGWDLLLDKGTYDAIALGEKDGSGESPVAAYPLRASRLLRENGYVLITCQLQPDLIPSGLTDHCPQLATLRKRS